MAADAKLLFVWIPRTGGTSLWSFLQSTGLAYQRINKGRPFDAGVPITTFQHQSIDWLLDSAVVTPEWLESRTIFSVVRNPWDRLVSIFARLHQGRPDQQAIARKMGESFADFAAYVLAGKMPPVNSRYVSGGEVYANRQTDWLSWSTGAPDFIVRFENMPRTWTWLGERLQMPAEPVHANATVRRPYQEYYTAALRDAVGEFYAGEIERFGYSF